MDLAYNHFCRDKLTFLTTRALAPVLRESINEAYPGCQQWFPDVILFRIGTKGDQFIGICKQKAPGVFTTKHFQAMIPEQFIKRLPCAPV